MHPWHGEWKRFSRGDVWDKPNDWKRFRKKGNQTNPDAWGGHSDALDWDRHLGHVSIIYDMLLPFILTDGAPNHDRDILNIDPEGKEEKPGRQWMQWVRAQLSEEDMRFLEGFGPSCALVRQGLLLRLHHGDFAEAAGSRLWPDSPEAEFEALARRYPEPLLLSGHSHIQFRRRCGVREFINPGSVGKPRLGRAEACYGLLEGGRIRLKAVPYDAERTASAMDRVPVERAFVEAEKYGFRNGVLAPVHHIRDYGPLREMGCR